VRFGPWYPVESAGDRSPAAEGVLQLRLARGLVDYPTGKSAMVAYRHAPDVRAAAQELARTCPGELLCRHLIEFPAATDLAAFCVKLREDFVRRFGRAPIHDP
jgi:hypothetical protein